MERLQKVIAQTNVSSRRQAEKLILEGRVEVDGVVVKELGTKVSKNQEIKVDGEIITKQNLVYLLLNKPTGVVSTTSDEKNRKTVIDLLDSDYKNTRVYPVGRLDFDTAGLILLTNDGELTKKLTHPSYEIEKEYLARVEGVVIRKKLIELRNGVTIDGNYFAKPRAARIVEIDKQNQSTLVSITISEGKNKQVRKMFSSLGFEVKTLTRIRFAHLTLDGVKRGSYRELKIHEIKKLYGITSQNKST